MPDPDRLHPAPAKPGKDPHRTAAFQEIGREIVHKDRYDRKAGLSVDTAGAIARALERAYARGFRDAQAPASVPSPADTNPGTAGAGEPIEWVLIPPRPRGAFWTICLFTLGRDASAASDGTGHLHLTAMPNGRPGWQLVTRTGHEDKPFGHITVLSLVRLGLLDPVLKPDRGLVVSDLGRATWWRFLERGGRYPDDLTSSAR